jgi:heptosyltransferase-3
MHIIISRTDNIGDVVLTLPVAVALRKRFPDSKISFLGKEYTRAVADACPAINQYISYNDLCNLDPKKATEYLRSLKPDVIIFVFPEARVMKWAADASIRLRIATAGRWHSWIFCNRRIRMSRKRSDLHEAQLNFKLLSPLGILEIPPLQDLAANFTIPTPALQHKVMSSLDNIAPGKRIILHALGVSGVDWPLSSFLQLGKLLAADGFEVIFTGTESDGIVLRKHLPASAKFHDVTGKFSLSELIQFMSQCQGIVACSTGPLHIAAALGITTVGLFSPHRPIHPGRWSPLGPNAHCLSASQMHGKYLDIPIEKVYQLILRVLP